MRRLERSGTAEAAPGEQVSIGRAFARDFAHQEDEREESAARERTRGLDALPLFFLIVHVICGGALLSLTAESPVMLTIAALIGGLVVADAGLVLFLRRRPLSSWQSHHATRAAACYALATSGAWCAACAIIGDQGGPATNIGPPGRIARRAARLHRLPDRRDAWRHRRRRRHGPALARPACAPSLAGLLALALVHLSLRRSIDAFHQLRRRLATDWSAQRANRFIEEFEQAGRGWFWETTGRGALSYVSEQLAADLKTPAAELIGKPFTDLIGVDDSGGSETSERTLGFHLSARLPFTDITVRAKTAAEIWWSLSGTPSFDEHGRFLGFRGIGSDLTQQRRSEQEINRLAKYDSLTGLPNRALMRRTLDEALQTEGAARRAAAPCS